MYNLNQISKIFYKDTLKSFLGLKKPEYFTALKNINLKFEEGDVIGVVGKNGSGKSTLLRILGNILLPDTGTLNYGESLPVTSYISSSERSFFWRLTVKENLDFFGAQYGLGKAAREKRIAELCKELYISNLANKQYMELSTGNKKKISFARSLLRDPDIFLFDEITSSLDVKTKEIYVKKIKELLIRKPKKIIFWVSHDHEEIKHIATKIIELDAGEVSLKKDMKE